MIKEKRHLPIHAKKVITMNAPIKMLVINPGSTSTKVSYFEGEKNIYTESIFHDAPELLKYPMMNVTNSQRFNEMEVGKFMDESIDNLNKLLDYIA